MLILIESQLTNLNSSRSDGRNTLQLGVLYLSSVSFLMTCPAQKTQDICSLWLQTHSCSALTWTNKQNIHVLQ